MLESSKSVIAFIVLLSTLCGCASNLHSDTKSNEKNTLAVEKRTLGQENAPVTMVVYCDYACPYCTAFQQEHMPMIKSDYIDTGKVKVQFRDYPKIFKHPGAMLAAQYADCAAEQDLFWEMHDRLYAGSADTEWFWGDESDRETLTHYAEVIGIDLSQLESCVVTQKMVPQVDSDMQLLHALLPDGAHDVWPDSFVAGEQGTPTFLINGMAIHGNFTNYREWKSVLDTALANAK